MLSSNQIKQLVLYILLRRSKKYGAKWWLLHLLPSGITTPSKGYLLTDLLCPVNTSLLLIPNLSNTCHMLSFLGEGLTIAPTPPFPLQLPIFNTNTYLSLSVNLFYLNVNNTHSANSNVVKYSRCQPPFYLSLVIKRHPLANYRTQQDTPMPSHPIALPWCRCQTYVPPFCANPTNHHSLSASINMQKNSAWGQGFWKLSQEFLHDS